MIRILAGLGVFAWIACPGSLAAQAPARAQTPPQAAPAPTAAPGQAQAPAPAPPPVPMRTEILRFDSWTATCHEFADGPKKRVCTAQLQLQQSGSNQIVFSWTMLINDNKQLVTVLQTPTGVAIAPGVEMTLEKAAKRTIPYETCDNGICTASIVMDNNLMRDMSAAANVQVTIQAINGRHVNFNIPLKGTDKALAHMRSKI